MAKVRLIFFLGLVAAGGALIVALLDRELKTPLGRTLAPLFGLLGRSTKDVDRMLSHVLPLEDIDEHTLGAAIKAELSGGWQAGTTDAVYVNALLRDLTAQKQRAFDYVAYVVDGPPNACALPGGIVLVTTGLLAILTTEAQLVGVLGHEVGHIERGHCFDAAKFQMLSRKLGGSSLGQVADAMFAAMVATSFSKTQEQEADDYGYQALIAHHYDPAQMSAAFAALQDHRAGGARGGKHDPFRDYIRSHPPLELRVENFRERARRWHISHAGERAYLGARNYRERVPRSQIDYGE